MIKAKDWTDSQTFHFIAGLIAGNKLANNNLPYYSEFTKLDDIPFGGDATLGLRVENILYTDVKRDYSIPFSATGVNIEFSSFSLYVKFDRNRCRVTSVDVNKRDYYGEFEVIIDNALGYVSIVGISQNAYINPSVLGVINITLLDGVRIDKTSPLLFRHVNCNDYRGNFNETIRQYSTVLKIVTTDSGGVLFFITPLKNIDGGLVSQLEPIKDTITSVIQSASPKPTGFYGGYSTVTNGGTGVCQVTVNVNEKANFKYDTFECYLQLDETAYNYINFIDIIGGEEWNTNYTIEDGYFKVTGVRDVLKSDSSTVLGLVYANVSDVAFKIPLKVIKGAIKNSTDTLSQGVRLEDGVLNFVLDGETDTSEKPPWMGTGNGGTGGVTVSGSIISTSSQVIWISAGGASVPVYLHAGLNKIDVYIPNLSGSVINNNSGVTISATGYILICGGFIIRTEVAKDAPKPSLFIEYSDKLKLDDTFEFYLINKKPVNLDFILEELSLNEQFEFILNNVTKNDKNFDDVIDFNDAFELILESNKKVNLDELLESLELSDVLDMVTIENVSNENSDLDVSVIDDVLEFDVKSTI